MKRQPKDKMIFETGDEKRRAGMNSVFLEGIVIPTNWDEKGNIKDAALFTFHEDEYLIDQDEKGGELLAFIRQQVKVSGEVSKQGGKRIIKVKEYELEKEQDSLAN